jgi:hypothetical protein
LAWTDDLVAAARTVVGTPRRNRLWGLRGHPQSLLRRPARPLSTQAYSGEWHRPAHPPFGDRRVGHHHQLHAFCLDRNPFGFLISCATATGHGSLMHRWPHRLAASGLGLVIPDRYRTSSPSSPRRSGPSTPRPWSVSWLQTHQVLRHVKPLPRQPQAGE